MSIIRKSITSLSVLALTAAMQIPVTTTAFASASSEVMGGKWSIESTDSKAIVSWGIPIEEGSVFLYRDGSLVKVDDENGQYIVPEVKANESLNFSIVITAPLTDSQLTEISVNQEIPKDQVASFFEQKAMSGLSLAVPISGTASIDSATAAPVLPDTTNIRYATFIREYSLAAPILGVCSPLFGRYRFRGDNRGFSPTSASFRTRFDVNIHWSKNTTSAIRLVGQTRREVYDDAENNWVLDKTATANNSSMIYKALSSQTSSFTSFHIQQDVVNPMCVDDVTNGVYFDYDVRVYRSGSYSFTGTSLLAPDHELYIKDSDATIWTTVFQKEVKTMDCLAIILYNIYGCTRTGTSSGTR